jgi:hypothetical protein
MSTPTLKPDPLPQGAPFAIGAAVVQALRTAPTLAGALVLDNPTRATDLAEGPRLVFFEDQADRLRQQPGQMAGRTYTFAVGVVSRAAAPRAAAHADYRAAKRVVRGCMPAIQALVQVDGAGLIEGDVSYRLENLDVGGALVIGLFSLDYRDKS